MRFHVGIRVVWRYMNRERRGVIKQIVDEDHRLVEYDDAKGKLFEVNISSTALRHMNLLEEIAEAATEGEESGE